MRQMVGRPLLAAILMVCLTLSFFYTVFNSESEAGEFVERVTQQPLLASELEDLEQILTGLKPKRTNIFFLKAHKCASSTIQNILMRFGLAHALSFVLPPQTNYLGNPQPFRADMIDEKCATLDGKYNIFAHHTRYDTDQVRSVMFENAAFVTVLRHPADLYESIFSYYSLNTFYSISFKELLKSPEKLKNVEARYAKKLGLNQMSFDLGLPEEDFTSTEKVGKFIKKIDTEFDLVMISEWMEASLVLLADLMNWPLDYVMFLKINARSPEAVYKMSSEERRTVSRWNSVDHKLYTYFLNKFKQRIRDYGEERMLRDIKKLLSLNSKLRFRCVESVNSKGFSGTQSYNLRNGSDWLCFYAARTELEFTEDLRTFQFNSVKVINKLKHLLHQNVTEFV
uniref:Galactosylceramide sulfotransferase-like n=1 Tax=Homalodisca liturata TaxID=320908 RepID=A0A1B6HBQ7_9HEMI